jgi:uncharacterized RDD family membrane protein YckC
MSWHVPSIFHPGIPFLRNDGYCRSFTARVAEKLNDKEADMVFRPEVCRSTTAGLSWNFIRERAVFHLPLPKRRGHRGRKECAMPQQVRANRILRILATLFDFYVPGLTVFMLVIAAFWMYEPFGRLGFGGVLAIQAVAMFMLLLYVGAAPSVFGNSLGKFLFGIKIVHAEDLGRLRFVHGVVRGLTLCLWPIEGFLILFTGKRWADKLTGTMAIPNPRPGSSRLTRLGIAVAVIVACFLLLRFVPGWMFSHTEAYQEAVEYLETHDVGLKTMGEPMKLNPIPVGAVILHLQGAHGAVTFSARGSRHHGLIVLLLERSEAEGSEWQVVDTQIRVLPDRWWVALLQ